MDTLIGGFTIQDSAGLQYAIQVFRTTTNEIKLKSSGAVVRQIGDNLFKIEGTEVKGSKI